jgi:hypothetical protein
MLPDPEGAPETPGQSSVTGALTPPPAENPRGSFAPDAPPPAGQTPGPATGPATAPAPATPPLPPRAAPAAADSSSPMASQGPIITAPKVDQDLFSGPAIGRAGALLADEGPGDPNAPRGAATILTAPSAPTPLPTPTPKNAPAATPEKPRAGTGRSGGTSPDRKSVV